MRTTLDFSKPHVLRDEGEYEAAVARIDELLRLDVPDDSDEAEELFFLSVLVEEYEDREHPVEGADPATVVDFILEQRGMKRADLAETMGGASRVSDFFNGKRPLSRNQALRLRDLLGVPLDVLITEG